MTEMDEVRDIIVHDVYRADDLDRMNADVSKGIDRIFKKFSKDGEYLEGGSYLVLIMYSVNTDDDFEIGFVRFSEDENNTV